MIGTGAIKTGQCQLCNGSKYLRCKKCTKCQHCQPDSNATDEARGFILYCDICDHRQLCAYNTCIKCQGKGLKFCTHNICENKKHKHDKQGRDTCNCPIGGKWNHEFFDITNIRYITSTYSCSSGKCEDKVMKLAQCEHCINCNQCSKTDTDTDTAGGGFSHKCPVCQGTGRASESDYKAYIDRPKTKDRILYLSVLKAAGIKERSDTDLMRIWRKTFNLAKNYFNNA